ncbi:MAG: SpoIIE family protein phosphatase [Alphaproteobacteria bacterium]|nr:SpoIIE family protein phosphatase [Alphaproteobacteria bacterium]
MAILRMLKGQGAQREFILEPDDKGRIGVLQIGRDAEKCHLVLSPKVVSREHAQIFFKDGAFYIEDLKSKAGTVLNGGRLIPHVPRELKHRDLINICDHIFSFLDADGSSDTGSSTDKVTIYEDDPNKTAIHTALDSTAMSMASRTSANALMKLAAFMRLTHDLRSTVSLDRLLEKVLESLLAMFSVASRGIILLQGGHPTIMPRSLVRFRSPGKDQRAMLNRGVLDTVMNTGKAVSAADRMTMCVPILDRHEQPIGVIQLDADRIEGPFPSDDLDLFLTAAMQVSFAIENAMLHEAALRERALEWELGIAHEIQISLLPSERPNVPGYEFWDYYAPAKQVGGDYYDYRELRGNRLAMLLGDVSGKGIPAALLMAKASTEFNVFLSSDLSPVEVVSTVNRRFVQRSADTAFMTMVLVVLDWSTHRLQLVNAGHIRPLLRRTDGQVVEIGAAESSLPLGIRPDVEYRQAECELAPGETLLLVTDGIIDAQNREGKLYGLPRLIELYSQAEGNAPEVGQLILNDTGRFVGDNDQFDDTCLMCIRRCP